jgi:hypothetical protein
MRRVELRLRLHEWRLDSYAKTRIVWCGKDSLHVEVSQRNGCRIRLQYVCMTAGGNALAMLSLPGRAADN